MKRIIEPELLDALPPDDPRAAGSRHDLRRLNTWMRNHAIMVRALQTAAADGGVTAIAKGLQVGETVVTDGQLRLAPGIKVKPRDKAAPGAGPNAQAAK